MLSRILNGLHQDPNYHGFYMEKRGPQINHLTFTDDMTIFTSGRSRSLQMVMKVLLNYESISGQPNNKRKSYFIIPSNVFRSPADRVKQNTRFLQKSDPFTYLGCPLYIKRQRIIYFSDIVSKWLVEYQVDS